MRIIPALIISFPFPQHSYKIYTHNSTPISVNSFPLKYHMNTCIIILNKHIYYPSEKIYDCMKAAMACYKNDVKQEAIVRMLK